MSSNYLPIPLDAKANDVSHADFDHDGAFGDYGASLSPWNAPNGGKASGGDTTRVRVGNADEYHGGDGAMAWRSDDGHVVELDADGSVRIESASGNTYTLSPGGELRTNESNRQAWGDRSRATEDPRGAFHWDDGRGNHLQVKDGHVLFGRDGGSVRHYVSGDNGTSVTDSHPVADGYLGVRGGVTFPIVDSSDVEFGDGRAGGALLDGGFELVTKDGGAVRSMDDGGYRWTDGEGRFLTLDGQNDELTLQNDNGDWIALRTDGSSTEGNVFGEKPSTDWPEYADVVDRDGGLRSVNNPDGSVTTTNPEGDFDLQEPDSGSLYRDSGSGELARVYPDGSWVLQEGSDDNVVVGHLAFDGPPPVGTGALENATMFAADVRREETPDGDKIRTFGDGTQITEFADGSWEYLGADGNVARMNENGDIRWHGPDVVSGRATSEEVAAGSLLRADGLPDAAGAEVAAEFNLTGEVTDGAGGGRMSERTYAGGGTLTTDEETGETVLDDGNGRTRTYDTASGEIIRDSDDDLPGDGSTAGGNVLGDEPRNVTEVTGGPDGASEFEGEDGFFQWQSDLGHVVQLDGLGGFFIESVHGDVYRRENHGELEVHDSGARSSMDGSAFEKLPGGGVRWSDGDGASVEIRPDGSSIFTRTDGSSRTRDADGIIAGSPAP